MEGFPVVSIVGYADSGKTTFVEKLIGELKRRGRRVGTVKHTSHPVELDGPGKDTWRHLRAGSDVVALAAPNGFRLMKEAPEPGLDEILAMMKGVDLVLTEGYKREKWPKILVCRSGGLIPPVELLSNLLAVVGDGGPDLKVPRFDFSDAAGAADLIEETFLR
ncbi:MAG: molybdopterin-guanine dinucleotide biosynthesis protein B [Firmicutes bacterium]|nr:molybdopterin-guanine dinucleotide biosynthesis protein B [Bacillota bacterium]